MKRQDPESVYHYFVRKGEQVILRVQAVGTGHMIAVVLDEIPDPPPPERVQVGDWIEYRFAVTKDQGNHLLGCRYEFSTDSTPHAFYRHQLVVKGSGPTCTYDNIPDLRKGDPLPENEFRFQLSVAALEC